jgi:transcription elongation factor GreA
MGTTAYITQDGLNKLKKEHEHLTQVSRPEISRQIAEARDKGDLSENAEYHAAKEAQAMLELKISKLKTILVNSRVIDESNLDASEVRLLNRIKIRNLGNSKIMEYLIVPEAESDLKAGKLSINTPIAKGLLGKKVGDKVSIKVPSGEIGFEVLEISL